MMTNRSGKVVLTAEPNNLTNINSYKCSGLANSKAVGIQFAKDAKDRPCAAMTLKVRSLSPFCTLVWYPNQGTTARYGTLMTECEFWRALAATDVVPVFLFVGCVLHTLERYSRTSRWFRFGLSPRTAMKSTCSV